MSLNQISLDQCSLPEAIELCVRHGVGSIGVWRHKLEAVGVREARVRISDAGLRVSSLCRGGMFPAATAAERQGRVEDNLRAIEQAYGIGAGVVVLVCGPPAQRDLAASRGMVADGIAALVDAARGAGVKLGIEPLHPMYAADQSVITSLREANDLAAHFDEGAVGVVVDVFHVWWDAGLAAEITRAGGRVVGFHVSDWLVPLPDILLGRGVPGDGVIEISRIRELVEQAGYAGDVEVEIFNRQVWDSDPDAALDTICRRFEEVV